MPDMFQRRPDWEARILDKLQARRIINGCMYLIPQARLVFGSNAKELKPNRPAALITFDQFRAYVLPGTGDKRFFGKQRKPFLVRVEDCVHGRLHCDTYLHADAESIPRSALVDQLCAIKPSCKSRIIEWFLKDKLDQRS